MNIEVASTDELINRLNTVSNQCNIKLTFADKKTFINIIDYAVTHGEYTNEGLRIRISENDLSNIVGFSERTITQTLKKFVTLNVIIRKRGEDKIYPFITIIKNEYIKKGE